MSDSKSISQDLNNIFLCAEWLVGQLRIIDQELVARIFQKAIDDAYSWIRSEGEVDLSILGRDFIKEQEVEAIHRILRRYAAIDNSRIRGLMLGEMEQIFESGRRHEN